MLSEHARACDHTLKTCLLHTVYCNKQQDDFANTPQAEPTLQALLLLQKRCRIRSSSTYFACRDGLLTCGVHGGCELVIVKRLRMRQAVQRGEALLKALRLGVEGAAARPQAPRARQPRRQPHVRLAQRALQAGLQRLHGQCET